MMTGVPAPSGAAAGYAMALQPDGKIVMAGSAGSGASQNFAVIRLNANGTLDSTFNGTGTVTTSVSGSGDDHANAVALQGDGKIVAAGSASLNFVFYFALARFNANGTPDASFGTKTIQVGTTYNEAYAVAVDAAGNIVMAGKAGDSPSTDWALVRYTAAGGIDFNFNGSGKVRTAMPFACSGGCVGQAQSIALQSDGKIVVGGWSGQLNNAQFVIVRYNSNGTIDTSFGSGGFVVHAVSGGNDEILAIKIVTLGDGSQRILAVGLTNPTGSKANYAIARYFMNGALDTGFGAGGVTTTSISGGNDIPASVTVDASGMIVIGGDRNDVSGDFVVARYTANGALDNTFGCASPGACPGYAVTNLAGTDQGKSVAVQPDGKIVVGGTAAAGTSSSKFAVVRYEGAGGVGGGGPAPSTTTIARTGGTNPAAVNSVVTFTATVTGSAGTPTGTVNFVLDGVTPLCSGIALSGGQASCATQSLGAGAHLVGASYSGSAAYAGSTSAPVSQTMSKTTPTVAVTSSSPNPSSVNAAVVVTYSVAASPSGPNVPSGNVTVSDGAVSCTASAAAGQCSIAFTTSGTKTLTASYTGDVNFNAATSAGFTHTVSGGGGGGGPNTLTITKTGSGSGTVTSSPAGISCGNDCTESFANVTSVTLTANAGGGSVFTGWLGGRCTGRATCVVSVSGATGVVATFAPNQYNPLNIDVDGNGLYDALTDGMLIMRYMFGMTGTALTDGAIGGGASRSSAAQVITYLDNIRPILDADGNGVLDALSDGLLIMRYLFGITGTALTTNAIGAGATRTSSAQITTYLDSITP